MPLDPNDPNIPTIGEPARIMLWYPTAMIHCKCMAHPAMNVIICTGFENQSKCGHCNTHYWIKGLKTDGTILIDFFVPPPPGPVM